MTKAEAERIKRLKKAVRQSLAVVMYDALNGFVPEEENLITNEEYLMLCDYCRELAVKFANGLPLNVGSIECSIKQQLAEK